MTRKKGVSLGDPKERGWLCEFGHPKYRVVHKGAKHNSKRVCHICTKIEKSDPRICIRGHKFPSAERQCRLCLIYRQNPWLKELDEVGIATCPRGHEMEHHKLNYNTPGRRCCGVCYFEAKKKNIRAAQSSLVGKPNVNRGKKVGVAKTFVDWVVVHRLMEGRLDEVYAMRRGTTTGPTPMEEWVAYNSFNPMESAHRLAYSEQDELCAKRSDTGKGKSHVLIMSFTARWEKWGTYGRGRGWKPRSLRDVLSEL